MYKSNASVWVVFLSFAFLTRLISFTFFPNYDEWYYLASWNGIKNGGVLYKTILDNKPPLAYFLYIIPDTFSLYATLSILSAVIAYFIGKIADNFYAGHVFLLVTGAVPSYLELNLEYWILVCILPAYYYILKKESIRWHKRAYFLCGASLMIKQHSLLLVIPVVLYGLHVYRGAFIKSIYCILVMPLLCALYIFYTNTAYPAYQWIIEFNFWYKDLSETGGYIWKRFIYGQLFALPVYAGILFCLRNIKKKEVHFLIVLALFLAVSSVWIGKQLYLHYQILIFPFLILFFYQISSQQSQRYVYMSIFGICIFGQANCLYAYLFPGQTWISRTEGVLYCHEKQRVLSLKTTKPIVFSAKSTLGLDYRKVKYIALCRSLEYLKKQNSAQKQLLSCDFHLEDAIYIVSKSCLNEYVGNRKYNVVYQYQDNTGITLPECE